MTTTELIKLLKKYEFGGATGRPREVMFQIDDEIVETDNIEVVGAGDGLVTELFLSLPSVERKKGKWIERESGTEDKENGFDTVIVCSCCDFPATTFYSEDCESRTQIRTDFCPNCGARMEGLDEQTKN